MSGARVHAQESEQLASVRLALEESRSRESTLEIELGAKTRREQELTFALREADAEKERLRTLLAGTVWFEAKA